MLKRTAQKRTKRRRRSLRSLSLMVMSKRMSWQRKERSWMKDSWRRHEQKRFSRSEKGCAQPLQYAASFTAWWRNGKIVKNSSRSQKKSGLLWTRKERKQCIDRNAAASKYRCMRCGRSSKYMKMQGQCAGPKYLSKNLGK